MFWRLGDLVMLLLPRIHFGSERFWSRGHFGSAIFVHKHDLEVGNYCATLSCVTSFEIAYTNFRSNSKRNLESHEFRPSFQDGTLRSKLFCVCDV